GPPSRAATEIWRDSLVNSLPRRASSFSFLCLMLAHFECPAMDDHLTVKKSYHDAAFAAKGTLIARWRQATVARRRIDSRPHRWSRSDGGQLGQCTQGSREGCTVSPQSRQIA